MRLGIGPGHIPRRHMRRNEHTGLDEDFDPNQIFLSPAIKYSGNPFYATFEVPIPCPPNHSENGIMMIVHFCVGAEGHACRFFTGG